ncbi:MAG: hypothetical protein AAB513_03340 [Patescibacteria group bacterium]
MIEKQEGPQEGKESVVCLSCHKQVEVKMIEYGGGHIATCPLCKELAYNQGEQLH